MAICLLSACLSEMNPLAEEMLETWGQLGESRTYRTLRHRVIKRDTFSFQ